MNRFSKTSNVDNLCCCYRYLPLLWCLIFKWLHLFLSRRDRIIKRFQIFFYLLEEFIQVCLLACGHVVKHFLDFFIEFDIIIEHRISHELLEHLVPLVGDNSHQFAIFVLLWQLLRVVLDPDLRKPAHIFLLPLLDESLLLRLHDFLNHKSQAIHSLGLLLHQPGSQYFLILHELLRLLAHLAGLR